MNSFLVQYTDKETMERIFDWSHLSNGGRSHA